MSASNRKHFSAARQNAAPASPAETENSAPAAVVVSLSSLSEAETPAETPAEVLPETPAEVPVPAVPAEVPESPAEAENESEAETETDNDDENSSASVSTSADGVVSATFNVRLKPPVKITVVRKFQPSFGAEILTDTHRAMLNKYTEEQFASWAANQAQTRVKRLAKAKTDSEREANRPLTAEDFLRMFSGFEPSVRERGPRQDPAEKLLHETAIEYWDGRLAKHNDLVSRGEPGIIASKLGQYVPLRLVDRDTWAQSHGELYGRWEGGKWVNTHAGTKPYRDYVAAVEKETAELIPNLLAHKIHRPAIDALLAAKKAAKTTFATPILAPIKATVLSDLD